MVKGVVSQEVSCVVALLPELYPSFLLQRKAAGLSAAGNVCSIGSSAGNAVPRQVTSPGVILEVRQLWEPPLSVARIKDVEGASPVSAAHPHCTKADDDANRLHRESGTATVTVTEGVDVCGRRATGGTDVPLHAFVRLRETDHRLSGWFPLHEVYVKAAAALAAFATDLNEEDGCSLAVESGGALPYGVPEDMVRLSTVLHRPWLSGVYSEITTGMARTQRAHRQLDYLEERLLRDGRTPTTVRYFIYLNTYVFAPWYYAPFGLLNREYDPMLPLAAPMASPSSAATALADGFSEEGARAAEERRHSRCYELQQPYIRDAFLCPFSLRVYSTYAQMHYETRTCRAGRLRPPGEEIYRDEARGLSLFKINGSQHVTYCRHLFLIGKSFLENKLAGHDVHSYFFYVVCLHHRYFPTYISDVSAMYFAGFFTWEKHVSEYNLACITTLPCFGRGAGRRQPTAATGEATTVPFAPPIVLRHLGQFMIAASYELAYRRKEIGTPEKPLSDLGAAAYQHYWRCLIVRWMKETLNAMRWASAVNVDAEAADVSDRTHSEREQETCGARGVSSGAQKLSPAPSTAMNIIVVDDAASDNDADVEAEEEGKLGDESDQKEKLPIGKVVKRKRHRAREGTHEDTETPLSPSLGKLPRTSEGHHLSIAASTSGKASLEPSDAGSPAQSPTSISRRAAADSGDAPPTPLRTTIRDIAAAVRLEEADVLSTLLRMGVLHRSSEDRTVRLLLPQRYVDWMYDELVSRESSMEHAVFQAALLKSRGTSAGTR